MFFSEKAVAILLFILMYVFFIALPKFRVFVALAAALLYVLLGILPVGEVPGVIDWNVLLMICGSMVVVDVFIRSRMPERIAEEIMDRAGSVLWVTIWMSLFAGLVSAFIDNVATVLMVAPVGMAICRKLNISPVSMILSIAVSSNLQGAATLVGDTTSIMLGAYAGMDFSSFFWMKGRPGIFFAVELGALMTVPIMLILFRKNKEPVEAGSQTLVEDKIPTAFLLGMIGTLIAASFIPGKPSVTNGVICMSFAVLALVHCLRQATNAAARRQAWKDTIKSVDYETLLLLTGLFIVIGAVTEAGVIDDMGVFVAKLGGKSLFLLYSVLVWGSVLVSAFIDNIPYVATMLPVVRSVSGLMGIEPYLLYFGLLSGATLGGNITPIGASANITAVGMLKKQGYEVGFKQFARIGIPFTLAAVCSAYIFLWIVWK